MKTIFPTSSINGDKTNTYSTQTIFYENGHEGISTHEIEECDHQIFQETKIILFQSILYQTAFFISWCFSSQVSYLNNEDLNASLKDCKVGGVDVVW